MTPLLVYISQHPLGALGLAVAAATTGSVLVGFFAALWRMAVPVGLRFFTNLLFDVHYLEWPVSEHVLRILQKEGRCKALGSSRYAAEHLKLRHEEDRERWVVFKALETSNLVCLWRRALIYVTNKSEHTAAGRNSGENSRWKNFNVFYALKRTVDWKALLTDAATVADREGDAADDPLAESAVRRYRVV